MLTILRYSNPEKEVKIFKYPGVTLGISIHGFTTLQGSDFISNFTGSSAKILEIHGFTGTQGTRPNVAPEVSKPNLSHQTNFNKNAILYCNGGAPSILLAKYKHLTHLKCSQIDF